MILLNLPKELLWEISESLDSLGLKGFLEVCPYLTFLIPLLETALRQERSHTLGCPSSGFRFAALSWAVDSGLLSLAKILLDNGADPNSTDAYGYPLLHNAIHNDNKVMTTLLLKHGADINALDIGKNAAFHRASMRNEDMVKLLLPYGFDINRPGGLSGWLPLHYAVSSGNFPVARFLLENGADINLRCSKGRSALHIVHQSQIASLLLEKGADVNARDNYGATPLFFVVTNCYSDEETLKTIELLLDNGADINAQNNKGDTAIHMSRYGLRSITSSISKVTSFLIEKGAKELPNLDGLVWSEA